MDLQTILENRRSIRQFQPGKAISSDTIKELITAALQAPSWRNSQTARYYVISSPEMLCQVRENCLPPFNANNSKDASALIVTTFVHGCSGFQNDKTPSNEAGNLWGAYDLGLHNENFILKAAEAGLGTLIMGIRDSEKLRELLKIPDSETVMAVIALGYPACQPSKPPRKDVDDITRFF